MLKALGRQRLGGRGGHRLMRGRAAAGMGRGGSPTADLSFSFQLTEDDNRHHSRATTVPNEL